MDKENLNKLQQLLNKNHGDLEKHMQDSLLDSSEISASKKVPIYNYLCHKTISIQGQKPLCSTLSRMKVRHCFYELNANAMLSRYR